MAVSAPLARILAAGRSLFNQRVVEARRRYPALDPQAFADFIEQTVDPLVVALASAYPDRLTRLVAAAFDTALEVVGSSKGHGGVAAVGEAWRTLAPAIGRHVVEDPQAVLAALGNAAITLAQHPGARSDEWLAAMLRLAPAAGRWSEVRGLGQVLAWRSGMAHYRLGALAAADALPEVLALQAVGASPSAQWPEVRAALQADPWFVPANAGGKNAGVAIARPDALVWQLGQFTGYGGPFAYPPRVVANEDGFGVFSGERFFHLFADAFGVALLPAANGEGFEPRAGAGGDSAWGGPSLKGSLLIDGDRRIRLDLPEEGLVLAANAHSLAVSSPYSYSVRIFARQCQLA